MLKRNLIRTMIATSNLLPESSDNRGMENTKEWLISNAIRIQLSEEAITEEVANKWFKYCFDVVDKAEKEEMVIRLEVNPRYRKVSLEEAKNFIQYVVLTLFGWFF